MPLPSKTTPSRGGDAVSLREVFQSLGLPSNSPATPGS
jgi:hypothetical protein